MVSAVGVVGVGRRRRPSGNVVHAEEQQPKFLGIAVVVENVNICDGGTFPKEDILRTRCGRNVMV